MVTPLLHWARRLQAIAQTGLAYGEPSQYDRDRYEIERFFELRDHSEWQAEFD